MSFDRLEAERMSQTVRRPEDDRPEPTRVNWRSFKDRLMPGMTYTYNKVRGGEKHWLEPGDEVRLKHTLEPFHPHVEVETLDGSCSGKVHVFCLMLAGGFE